MKKSVIYLGTLVTIYFQLEISGGQNLTHCNFDDIQKTPGVCLHIRECRYGIHQLYTGKFKRCPGIQGSVCCPTEPTLSQKKCSEWKEVLKEPEFFIQDRFAEPICAYKGHTELIVGGRDAHEFEYPHAVGLGYGDNPENLNYNCGATLISENYLLTAAHCLTNAKAGKPRYAVIGDLTLKNQTSFYRKEVPIAQWIIHPDYSPPLIYDDIALLKLSESLEISRYVLPACIGDPVVTPNKGNEKVTAIGWGQLGFLGSQASALRAAQLSIVGFYSCIKLYSKSDEIVKSSRYPKGILKSQLCAGTIKDKPRNDTCNGDSGGGIFVNPEVPCLHHIVGITSAGPIQCLGEPGIYTKIAFYTDWIERTVWGYMFNDSLT